MFVYRKVAEGETWDTIGHRLKLSRPMPPPCRRRQLVGGKLGHGPWGGSSWSGYSLSHFFAHSHFYTTFTNPLLFHVYMPFLLGWNLPQSKWCLGFAGRENGQLLNELTSDHSSAREELDALQAGHLSWKTQTGWWIKFNWMVLGFNLLHHGPNS